MDPAFDLEGLRLRRLRQDLDAAFPGEADAALRDELFRILAIGIGWGVDVTSVVCRLRAKSPPPGVAEEAGMEPGRGGVELEMDALPEPRRATLWPYRPKRKPEELLSSWLWRVARGLGAPPRRFVRDAVGADLADLDKGIGEAAVERLAFWSGQPARDLMRGTMRASDAGVPVGDGGADRARGRRERVQQMLLSHGDLVLNRCRGGRGRAVPIIQYCPVCLGGEDTAYLRRGWRFSFEVACFEDGCLLLDACWRCGALLDPLAHTAPCTRFACVACGAPLSGGPSLHVPESVRDQARIYAGLYDKLFGLSDEHVGLLGLDYIDVLSSGDLHGTNPANAADRHNAVMLEAGWPSSSAQNRHGATAKSSEAKRAGKAVERARAGASGRRPDRAARRPPRLVAG